MNCNNIKKYNYLEKIFINVGFNMPSIAFLLSFIYIFLKKGKIMLFIIFFFLCMIINTSLKLIIKEQRPEKRDFYTPLLGHEYGMPSGHAQLVTFSLFYLYLLYPNNPILLFIASLCTTITSYQRVYTKMHTKKQVYAGIGVGLLLAFIASNIVIPKKMNFL